MHPPIAPQFPNGLNLTQFIQTVLTGISGFDGVNVRPKWQVAPPKEPDINLNWLAFGVDVITPDANGFLGMDAQERTIYLRHETLQVSCAIFGPDALETAEMIRDGFQIPNNREALFKANMGFVETSEARRLPELINERFRNRIEMNVVLRREVQRVYPILSIISVRGTVHTVLGNEAYLLNWQTPGET